MSDELLKVGDHVVWRPMWGFGPAAFERPKVVGIEVQERRMEAVAWAVVQQAEEVYVDLSNGHWAYGDQLSPATKTEEML